jgi:hypothetical protein
MGTQIVMTVGSHVATAELFTEAAPSLCRAFLETLPIDTFTVHAKFAGNELIAMLPFFHENENKALAVDPGDIGYYPNRQTLCLFYGDITPFGTVSSFARVVDGLEAMRRAGEEVQRVGSLPTRIELADGSRPPGGSPGGREWAHPARPGENGHPSPDGSAGRDAALPSAAVAEFLQRVWLNEPADVAKLRTTARPPLGNGPCVLYANFDLFWLGENLLVCREQLRGGAWPVEQVASAAAGLARHTADRLEKWGFPDTVGLLRHCADALAARPPGDAAAYLAFFEGLLLAVNRVQTWVDAAIPWAALDRAITLHETPSTAAPAP